MHSYDFSKLLASLSSLTERQHDKLLFSLNDVVKQKSIPESLKKVTGRKLKCPHCKGKRIVRFGKASGLQRYRCKQCFRTFNTLTGTPLSHLRYKERWENFSKSLIEGQSVRKSASECAVHRNTTFRWRHRFLKLPADMQANKLSVIAEADETYFLKSMKGDKKLSRPPRKRGGKATKRGISKEQACVLIARDRSGHTLSKVMETFNSESLKETLKPKLAKAVILCSDGLSVYKSFTKQSNIFHRPINVKAGIRVIDKVFHIQNVNAYDSRLHKWMLRFDGVATKYLQNYLGWFRMIDSLKEHIKPKNIIAAAIGIRYQQLTVT